MEKIIYKNDQGNLSIVMPTEEALQHMSIYEIAKKDVPTGKNFKIINSFELPLDKTFRDAWTIKDLKIIVDLDKAKEIWKNTIRKHRILALKKLDTELIIATEKKLNISSILNKKEELRNLPNKVDDVKSLDQIKNVWSILLNNNETEK
tara:strand:+ start:1252 stop:1698 length:447 start_codon:yes stop_codon:yes gene_type:complete